MLALSLLVFSKSNVLKKYLNKIINKKPIQNSKLAKAKIKKLKLNKIKSSLVIPISIDKTYKIIQIISANIIVFKKLVEFIKIDPRTNQKNSIKKFIQFINFIFIIILLYYFFQK